MRVGYSDEGRRCGETHHNSTISDDIVRQIRDLHEYDRLGYRRISKIVKLSWTTVAKICQHRRRATPVTRWKRK